MPRLGTYKQHLKNFWLAGWRGLHRRAAVGWTLGLLLACLALASVLIGVAIWRSPLTFDQRLVAIGDTFTIGAFTLAVLGAVVALLAYRLAIQRPRLRVHVQTDDNPEGIIEVGLSRPDGGGERHMVRLPGFRRTGSSIELAILIENTSDWSARNVAVRVDFHHVRRVPLPGGWSGAARHRATNEETAVQWEGGADYAVHGHWTRHLPMLYLDNAIVEAPGDDCTMTVDVVAEGFRQSWTYPIKWTTAAEVDGTNGGAISGYTGYPSSAVPPMHVYAVPITVGHPTRVEPIILGYGYRWWWIDDVDPGDYHIFAYPTTHAGRGAFTEGGRRDDLTGNMDHTLATVTVKGGAVTDGVRITDWYASDLMPVEPERGLMKLNDQLIEFSHKGPTGRGGTQH